MNKNKSSNIPEKYTLYNSVKIPPLNLISASTVYYLLMKYPELINPGKNPVTNRKVK